MTLHASPVEVGFTVVFGAGFLLRAWALRDAWQDWRNADPGDKIVQWIAINDIIGDASGLLVKASLFGIGVWAMLTPANQPPKASTFSLVAGIVLIMVGVIMDANTALGVWLRRRIRDLNGDRS